MSKVEAPRILWTLQAAHTKTLVSVISRAGSLPGPRPSPSLCLSLSLSLPMTAAFSVALTVGGRGHAARALAHPQRASLLPQKVLLVEGKIQLSCRGRNVAVLSNETNEGVI